MNEQIDSDFKNITSISQNDVFFEWLRIHDPNLRLYQIMRGKVFGRHDKMYRFLQAILEKYDLPDLVFLYATADIVRKESLDAWKIKVPIFCSAKAPLTDGKIIHFIDWYFDPKATNSGLISMIREIDFNRTSWESKKHMLFWRGGTTDCYGQGTYRATLDSFPRGILVQKSQNCPDLIDAKFNWLANPALQNKFPTGTFVSIKDHLFYKYQIAMDGETATYPGYQWRLYSGCVCLKQDSPDTMWFYGALIPWVHYVPVQRDLSDLEDVLHFLLQHDEEAKKIAENAFEFTKENLMPQHMLLYGYKVLVKYASVSTK